MRYNSFGDTLGDDDVFTYGRNVKVSAFRAIVKALDDNTIPHRVIWKNGEKFARIYVKPERQRRFDKFVDRFNG